jgi:antitoxin HicB
MKKPNPRGGSNFDDFLKDERLNDGVTAKALNRAISEQLKEGMATNRITKVAMAARMKISGTQIDRLLDPDNLKFSLIV